MRFTLTQNHKNLATVCGEVFPCRSNTNIIAIGESHDGAAHERAVQEWVIKNAAAGTPVVIEAGSRNDSLAFVESLAHARGDLPVVTVEFPDGALSARGEVLYKLAGQQVENSPAHTVLLFCGAGYLKGVHAAAAKGPDAVSLVNLAETKLLPSSFLTKIMCGVALMARGDRLQTAWKDAGYAGDALEFVKKSEAVTHIQPFYDEAAYNQILVMSSRMYA
ncbi:MAG: hypothetical protein GC136_04870 [Alphaproteobacteria bacterium]|nr:hypothetical protein [Alphaproteobacteria bacterium]